MSSSTTKFCCYQAKRYSICIRYTHCIPIGYCNMLPVHTSTRENSLRSLNQVRGVAGKLQIQVIMPSHPSVFGKLGLQALLSGNGPMTCSRFWTGYSDGGRDKFSLSRYYRGTFYLSGLVYACFLLCSSVLGLFCRYFLGNRHSQGRH